MKKTSLFLPYDLSLEMKDIGFDEPCFAWYSKKYLSLQIEGVELDDMKDDILAPLYQQAIDFFRERHELYSSIIRIGGGNDETGNFKTYRYSIFGISDNKHQKLRFRTYEEAELECLKKLIEIVKSKNS